MKWIICLAAILTFSASLKSQEITHQKFPEPYYSLTTDSDRLSFLANIINDSLDEGQITNVYTWGRFGLKIAEDLKNDTMIGIFNFFIAKAFVFQYNKYDSAIFYYKKVLPHFPDKLRKYNVYSVREIMERYSELGKKDSSFAYMNQLIELIDTMANNNPRKISLSQNIAGVYQWFGYHNTAIRYFNIAIKGNQENGNKRGLGLALANLGELYNEMEDDEKAILTSKEALAYLADVAMPFSQTAGNIADFYCNQEKYDSAKKYLNIAIAAEKKLNNEEIRISNDNILSNILLAEKKYEEVEKVLNKNLELLLKTDDHWNQVRTYFHLARLDTSLNNLDKARNHLLQGLAISKKDGTKALQVIALQNLSIVSKKLGNLEDALKYQSEYIELKDSITSEKNKASLADLEISYKTAQKEQQIDLLQKENQLKTLEISNSRQKLLLSIGTFLMLLLIAGIIFYQRNQKAKLKSLKEKAELETKVMRLQMNPHFIFNSLNSIENFIMQNEKRLASDYLNKFARLIRLILDSSRTEVVPLEKDMEALQLYIDLEQLRFSNKFRYKTEVDPALIGGDYQVPSLLIQPYVENAIVHGMAHSEADNLQLTIRAKLENDTIHYVVEDNGVGRLKAASYNKQNKPYHESIGLSITEERVRLFNNESDSSKSVRIIDLYDEQQTPSGTRVEINLKAV